MNGGSIAAQIIKKHGVDHIFTLVGGHIAPILVASKNIGVRVVDVRHEVNAVFAADAWARLKGIPGVAVVTAGPGVTNTITAIRNALMAQSPLVLIGGATATALKGRGSLQDIDQLALMRSNVKWQTTVRRYKDIAPALNKAFRIAREGIPGPVFVELPIDLLYDKAIVSQWYAESAPKGNSLTAWAIRKYLAAHVKKIMAGYGNIQIPEPEKISKKLISAGLIHKIATELSRAKRPLILAGSQVLTHPEKATRIAQALKKIGVPVYLSGMARGLLGENDPIQFKQKRKEALKECDLVILLGVPADFRLNYGAHIKARTLHIAANLDAKDLKKNKRPHVAVHGDPGDLLLQLAEEKATTASQLEPWFSTLREREKLREAEIVKDATKKMGYINPVDFFLKAAPHLSQKTILVADGGDFVGTGAYIVRPGGPLTWLDPGVFGTLGVGAGFALGAKMARPDHDVIILYGDGSSGYSLMEFDTFARHRVPIGAIIGNDACWMQIYRDQKDLLKDDTACMLEYSDYQKVAQIFGGTGLVISKPAQISGGLKKFKQSMHSKKPTILNVLIGRSEFRKGSISV